MSTYVHIHTHTLDIANLFFFDCVPKVFVRLIVRDPGNWVPSPFEKNCHFSGKHSEQKIKQTRDFWEINKKKSRNNYPERGNKFGRSPIRSKT